MRQTFHLRAPSASARARLRLRFVRDFRAKTERQLLSTLTASVLCGIGALSLTDIDVVVVDEYSVVDFQLSLASDGYCQ